MKKYELYILKIKKKKILGIVTAILGLGLLFYFISYPSLDNLTIYEISILKKIVIKFLKELIFNSVPRFYYYFYVSLTILLSFFLIFMYYKNKIIKNLDKRKVCQFIIICIIYPFVMDIFIVGFLMVVVEAILFYKIIVSILISKEFEFINNILFNVGYSNEGDKEKDNEAIKIIKNIFLICLIFTLLLSIDYTIISISSSFKQINIIKILSENDSFFIINKFIDHVVKQSSKSIMYDTIIQMSSIFITFMGFIISFLTGNIFSINIHTIICWQCNQFKLFYHRIVTIVIVIISFFISSTEYTVTIIFLDVYLIWIIIYNIYLISTVSLYSNFPSILAKRMKKDMIEISKIIDNVSKGITNKNILFYNKYLPLYGKSIYLPLNLLTLHIKNNKEEYYQLTINTINQFFKKKPISDKKNFIVFCLIIDKWFVSYLEQLENKEKKIMLDELDIYFIFDILMIMYDKVLEKKFNDIKISYSEVIVALILKNIFMKIDVKDFQHIINIYKKHDESFFNTNIRPPIYLMVCFMIDFYKTEYINELFEFIDESLIEFESIELKNMYSKSKILVNEIFLYFYVVDNSSDYFDSFYNFWQMREKNG